VAALCEVLAALVKLLRNKETPLHSPSAFWNPRRNLNWHRAAHSSCRPLVPATSRSIPTKVHRISCRRC